ncbi:MAG: hypothetical protein AAFO03_10440 [Bacteroidota bacterium]
MFRTIFQHELRHWLRQIHVYAFAIILLLIAWATMWGMAGEASGEEMMNSYYRLNFMSNYLSMLMVFLLPGTLGAAVYRDYKSQMYQLLYAYPITKQAYLFAKFLAAFIVVSIVVGMIGLGFFVGTLMPGVNQEVILPFDVGAYVQLYGVFILPNMLFFGLVTLALVLRTRSIYVAFIGILLLVLFQMGVKAMLFGEDLATLAILLDPLGDNAVKYTVRYWSIAERNTQALPISGLILYNRLLWLGLSALIGVYIYRQFSFRQFVNTRKRQKATENTTTTERPVGQALAFPSITLEFSGRQRLMTAWHTAVADFRYIVFSWPFMAILLAGGLLVFFQQQQMNPAYGFELLPTTAQMLRFPMFIFGLVINLLTFLYIGTLHFRGQTSGMGPLIDTLPQRNGLLLATRLSAALLMQLLLLSLVMLTGILAQTLQGYYHYELWHYTFELLVLQFVHFMIWACAAVLVYTLVNNLYLGFFILLILPTAVTALRPLSDFLGWPFLRQSILQFNQVPGVTVGFDYSDLSGYGSVLPLYASFKGYWLLLGVLFLLLSVLFWPRGLTFSWRERLNVARLRFRGTLRIAIIVVSSLFLMSGTYLYVQENHKVKAQYNSQQQEWILVNNEKRYSHFENYPQPRLAVARTFMDIHPAERDFIGRGELGFVNRLDWPIDTILVATSFREETSYQLFNKHELVSRDDSLRFDVWHLAEPLQLGDTLWMGFTVENYPNNLLYDNSRAQTNGTYITANILPQLGFRSNYLTGKDKREKYGLPPRTRQERLPTDSTLLGYAFAENNMGQIWHETTISTSADQIPFSIGQLIDEWQEAGRNYRTYRSDGPIINNISWLSGAYEQTSATMDNLHLQLFFHKTHQHNYQHLSNGLQKGLAYNSRWFGALDYDTLRLIEFPLTEGTYATLNGNLIPYSEALFLCDVDDQDNDVFNMPFYTAAHEVSHYWWGHRIDPANVDGGKIVTEAMAEYLAMRVLEEEFGTLPLTGFRKKMHRIYLRERARKGGEQPLIFAKDQQEYLTYRKGGLAMYGLSVYWGEEELNTALAAYERKHRWAQPPYPTSLSFIDHLADAIPDSLAYLLDDYFRTITLYDNSIRDFETLALGDTTFETKVNFSISKYQADANGEKSFGSSSEEQIQDAEKQSLPLNDYIQIGFYQTSSDKAPTHIRLIKVDQIENELRFELPFAPQRVEIDPLQLLFEEDRLDNVREE